MISDLIPFYFRTLLILFVAALPFATNASTQIEFTAEEKVWLAEQHKVRVRVANVPPYMIVEPELTGVSVDYIKTIADRVGFEIELVPDEFGWKSSLDDVTGPRKHYDLLLTIRRTPDRERLLAITTDYISAPWVMYTRGDSPYYSGLDALKGKTIVVEQGFLVAELLRDTFPAIHLVEVKSSSDALFALATGQADAYVGNLAISNNLIRANHLNNLSVTAPTPFGSQSQAMAVRKDWAVLAGLIDKGFMSMTAQERMAIDQKWGVIEFKRQTDYTLVWQILAAATFIFLAFLYWNRKLASEIKLRRRTEQKLLAANERSEAATNAKNAFLANISHEMHTPLHQIIGMAQLIEFEHLTPKQIDRMGKLKTATSNLTKIIDSILEVTKFQSDKIDLPKGTIAWGQLINDSISTVRDKAAEKDIRIIVESDNLPENLIGDSSHLTQALQNYLVNAIRFSQCKTIKVRSILVEEDLESALIRFEVKDDGVGISADQQTHLFAMFEQLDNSSTRKHGGIGIGLFITKRIAQIMGGNAGCDSSEGQGSSFWFTVKLNKNSPLLQ
ncbi:ATP-binding protein [Dechloromonas sp. HYN0024]|uniref:ATP-binding protein n=1 Tax=Dechloromonas sp. HYN0024 TaxID=2231055 RepID=UPI000E437A32|nr:transporter substrate-binding domain-containing protein [Dechloromonas sp. HYN0024]AXS79526.1 hypothetical protein HYN24_05520 [Dechloromonas sp. HYN0024]